ncbi:translation initiation factor IF-2-like [Dipodomys spectabilis]|uniref:translation initiation factor IF-2-like n=1 Tax=Dipodomys spectabilis TaxID=105255 RepID=UPI001C537A46|nr:translation initiation factor IF-2-like [Dipodomys spectabilis]
MRKVLGVALLLLLAENSCPISLPEADNNAEPYWKTRGEHRPSSKLLRAPQGRPGWRSGRPRGGRVPEARAQVHNPPPHAHTHPGTPGSGGRGSGGPPRPGRRLPSTPSSRGRGAAPLSPHRCSASAGKRGGARGESGGPSPATSATGSCPLTPTPPGLVLTPLRGAATRRRRQRRSRAGKGGEGAATALGPARERSTALSSHCRRYGRRDTGCRGAARMLPAPLASPQLARPSPGSPKLLPAAMTAPRAARRGVRVRERRGAQGRAGGRERGRAQGRGAALAFPGRTAPTRARGAAPRLLPPRTAGPPLAGPGRC